jgi:mandelamide amidase
MKAFNVLLVVVALVACTPESETERETRPVPQYPSAVELAALLDSGATTSVAIVTELLARAEANAGLNAFITVNAEGAMARAAELDELRQRGELLGPLHGLPLVVKDNIHVAGLPNTAGTPGLAGYMPVDDNAVVAALRDAGAIILGKTNLHELAFGITSDNGAYGSVGNPFNPAMFAGGSSGGTAAAISSGITPAGLGTDTGGSVRIPAALTGIVGFRPTTGRYDSTAVTPISHTRDTVGVMARSVGDVILMDSVIAPAGDGIDAAAAGDIRLGVPRAYYFDNVDAQAAAVIKAALDKLVAAGVTLVDVDPTDVGSLNERSAFPIALAEVVEDLPAYLAEYDTGADFASIAAGAASPDVQGLFGMLGTPEGQIPEEVYAGAMAAKEEMRVLFRDYFADNDLDGMIFPTTLLPARPIEGSLETVELNGSQVPTFPTYIHNTDPASIAALPGISLPVGVTADGMPVGLEIDGPEGSDRALLSLAALLEDIVGFAARP